MKGRSPTPISYGPDGKPCRFQSPAVASRCEFCQRCSQDLRKQAFNLAVPNPRNRDFLLQNQGGPCASLVDQLQLVDHPYGGGDGRCELCGTPAGLLKQEAVLHMKLVDCSQPEDGGSSAGGTISGVGGGPGGAVGAAGGAVGPGVRGTSPARPPPRTSPMHRQFRCVSSSVGTNNVTMAASMVGAKGFYNICSTGFYPPVSTNATNNNNGSDNGPIKPPVSAGCTSPNWSLYAKKFGQLGMYTQSNCSDVALTGRYANGLGSPQDGRAPSEPPQATSPQSMSAAASFFARAGQKMSSNGSSRETKKKRKTNFVGEVEMVPLLTSFGEILRHNPPPAPPLLTKADALCRFGNSGIGKVKVLLRVCQPELGSAAAQAGLDSGSCVAGDPLKRQITFFDPSTVGGFTSPSQRRAAPPKMFAFDSVYADDEPLSELCPNALTEIVQAVVNGSDGCLLCLGHARLGRTSTMLGSDGSSSSLGVIPCAISWLFQLINEQKERTNARFSVRVSAVEVHGKDETLRDLLAEVAEGHEAGGATAPGVYLRDDPISGTQLENQSELRAPSADKAGYYLDAAIAARQRRGIESDDTTRLSHLLFTLHVYQYRVEKSGGGSGVAGGRSRLHLVELGSGRSSKDPGQALTLSGIASVLIALLNGQRHIPYRDSKLSQLLREALGSLACRTCLLAQVSPQRQHYAESLQVAQLAAKIQRLRRRRAKLTGSSGASSDDSSSCDSFGMRRAGRLRPQMGLLRTSALTSASEQDNTSSSEQSCDTVIYRGGAATDTDGEGPPGYRLRRHTSDSDASSTHSGSRASGSRSPMSRRRATPRTNALAWPRLAVRNAVETLSTQKEQWVDGPKAVYPEAEESSPAPPPSELSVSSPPPSEFGIASPPPLPPTAVPPPPTEPQPPPPQPQYHVLQHPLQAPSQPPFNSAMAPVPAIMPSDVPPMRRPQLVDKETQSEEPFESESSASTASTYSTVDRKHSRVLSDISERTEDPDTSANEGEGTATDDGEQAAMDRDGMEEDGHNVLDSIEPPSMMAPDGSGGSEPQLPPCPTSNPSGAPCGGLVQPFVREWVDKHSGGGTGATPAIRPTAIDVTKPASPASSPPTPPTPLIHLQQQQQQRPEEVCGDRSPGNGEEAAAPSGPLVESNVHSGLGPRHHSTAASSSSRHSSCASSSRHSGAKRQHRCTRRSGSQTRNTTTSSAAISAQMGNSHFARVAEWVKAVSSESSRPTSPESGVVGPPAPPPLPPSRREARRGRSMPPNSVTSSSDLEGERQWLRHQQQQQRAALAAPAPSLVSRASSYSAHDQRVPPLHAPQGWAAPQLSLRHRSRSAGACGTGYGPQQPPVTAAPIPPSCLRQPDGASNPHLHQESMALMPGGSWDPSVAVAACRPPPVTKSSKSLQLKSAFCAGRASDEALTSQKGAVGGIQPPPSSPRGRSAKESKRRPASSSPANSTGRHNSCPPGSPARERRKAAAVLEGKAREPKRRFSLFSLFSRKKDKKTSKEKGLSEPMTSPAAANATSSQQQRRFSYEHVPGVPTSASQSQATAADAAASLQQLRLLSPYSMVTQPRHSFHSSSGHGSDCSSSLFGWRWRGGTGGGCGGGTTSAGSASGHASIGPGTSGDGDRSRRSHRYHGGGGASSGYESMLRDSEVSSSHADSTSESSVSASANKRRHRKKRSVATSPRRAQSVPPTSVDAATSTVVSQVAVTQQLSGPTNADPTLWTEKMQPAPAGFQARPLARAEEVAEISRQIRYEKIHELLSVQDMLKQELIEAKDRLMVDTNSWNFDLHVADQMDPEDAGFLEALEKETEILQKRVDACKSHIMMVTSFDAKPHQLTSV